MSLSLWATCLRLVTTVNLQEFVQRKKKGYDEIRKKKKKKGKGDFTIFYMKILISTYMKDLLLKMAQICRILQKRFQIASFVS